MTQQVSVSKTSAQPALQPSSQKAINQAYPKPYQAIPISECGDRLVPIAPTWPTPPTQSVAPTPPIATQRADPGSIPTPIATSIPTPIDQPTGARLALISPHPYIDLGAPYGDRSPFWLRAAVADRLYQAAEHLAQVRPGWGLQVFDAYRPVAVQNFMVEYTFADLARAEGQDPATIVPGSDLDQRLRHQVSQFWATPSLNPATPPPHSTGAAIDLTLLDPTGQPVDMGSPIDECSPRSFPHYFENDAFENNRGGNPGQDDAVDRSEQADPETDRPNQPDDLDQQGQGDYTDQMYLLGGNSDRRDDRRLYPQPPTSIATVGPSQPTLETVDQADRRLYCDRRRLLAAVMTHAGFVQHPNEWWHFSWGDQLWAWLKGEPHAHYGRSE